MTPAASTARRSPDMAASTPAERRRHLALQAVAHLRATSPGLAAIIDQVGPHRPVLVRSPFLALTISIIQQQISMLAARAVYERLRDLCPGRRVRPEFVAELSPQRLRRAGLSRQKAAYIRGLARAFAERRLTPARLRRLSDEDVIAAVTELHGVGRWTAEMLLMFCLERPDVWPVDDLGLRRAVERFVRSAGQLSPRELRDIAEPWRPYRSYAAWYLWRFKEGANGQPGVPVA